MQNYGDTHTALYDVVYGAKAPSTEIHALEKLAEGGRVLELGLGARKAARPLAKCGMRVAGIDNSAKMLSKLIQYPSVEKNEASIGDMPVIDAEDAFQLIFCLDQFIESIAIQGSQIEGLANAEAKRAPGGKLVLETFVAAATPEKDLTIDHSNNHTSVLCAIRWEPVSQTFQNRKIAFYDCCATVLPFNFNGSSEAERDLMPWLSKLTFKVRWSDWNDFRSWADVSSLITNFDATAVSNIAKQKGHCNETN